jgi:MFS superfamily sulfate permease-like transporter
MANQSGWIWWMPGLIILRQYQASWLVHDVTARIVLATMLVPVGIAELFKGRVLEAVAKSPFAV